MTHTARTMLEALIQERRWSHTDFCRAYAEAATDLRVRQTITPQHAGRWLGGKLKGLPYPAQRRVLEYLFGLDASILLGPPKVIPPTKVTSPRFPDPGREVGDAASESAHWAQTIERTNVGPHTLDQFQADVTRIATVYPNRPVYPLFAELRELRNRAFDLLNGRQFPHQTRELYLVTGLVCGILANASFDLGNLPAAETQARTAFLCAEMAGHNALRSWIRGTQALVAYWDDRPHAAVDAAVDGMRYRPESGTAYVRLAAIEARARGRLGDIAGTEAALRRADQASNEVIGVDEPGGMMAFPEAKRLLYAATARLWLGGTQALRHADQDAYAAVLAFESAPPQARRLGELSLARLDLASARLPSQLDGAAEQIRAVLYVTHQRPTDSVVRRLRQVTEGLDRPFYHGSFLASTLRHEITACLSRPVIPAVNCGDDQ